MSTPELSLTLDDYFEKLELEHGVISLTGEIDNIQTDFILRRLRWISKNIKDFGITEVTLLISSPGGSVYDSLALYDAIKSISDIHKIPVIGVAQGLVASAAIMIVMQACTLRLTERSTRFLLHEISSWSFGEDTAAKTKDTAKELQNIESIVLGIMSKRCEQKSAEEIYSTIEGHDVWLSATQAIEWGLIDSFRYSV